MGEGDGAGGAPARGGVGVAGVRVRDGTALALGRDDDTGADEAALITAARGAPAAFGILHQRYHARVYRYLRARTESPEDAADLTQQVFLQAFDALPRYRERGLPFAAWLFRIARNAATDFHRRRRQTVAWDHLPEALHPAAQGPEGTVLRREALARLRDLLATLPADKRELLALRFVAGLSQREIAAVVGKSEDAVQKGLTRLLHSLKERYDDA